MPTQKAQREKEEAKAKETGPTRRPPRAEPPSLVQDLGALAEVVAGELGDRVRELAIEAGGIPLRLGRALFIRPRNPKLANEAGAYLRELREVAGLTLDELADAIDLQDRSLLDAVERGTATLSFELIFRLASILARHDPVPFVLRFTRTYNPELWKILEGWGIGRLPLQAEREREFLNIYRSRDVARELSDEDFARVLDFMRAAFDLSLHFRSSAKSPRRRPA